MANCFVILSKILVSVISQKIIYNTYTCAEPSVLLNHRILETLLYDRNENSCYNFNFITELTLTLFKTLLYNLYIRTTSIFLIHEHF